jgi:putative flippase GtrA
VDNRQQRTLFSELLCFGAVGILATGIYIVATLLLRKYGRLSVPLAASISFILVVATNYALHYSWTFRSAKSHTTTAPRFIGTSVGGMIINTATVTIGARCSTLPQNALLLLGVGLVVIWNYLLARFWVFTERPRGRIG